MYIICVQYVTYILHGLYNTLFYSIIYTYIALQNRLDLIVIVSLHA